MICFPKENDLELIRVFPNFFSMCIFDVVLWSIYLSGQYDLLGYVVMLMTFILVINAELLNFLNRVIGIISLDRLFLSSIADTMN